LRDKDVSQIVYKLYKESSSKNEDEEDDYDIEEDSSSYDIKKTMLTTI
jgi:hypothetical protein